MNRFRFATTSVRGRILAGFAFIILLVIGITVAGYIQLNQVRAASTEIVPTSAQIEQLQDFALALTAYQGDLDRYFTIGGQEFREAILTDLDNMDSISAALQAETDSPDLVRLVEEEEFLRTESLIILDTENSGLTGTQINLKIIELYRRVDTITELHEGLTDQALTQMRGTADTQQSIISRVLTQFAVLGVVITVVAVAAVAIVTRILAPIGTLTEVALDISSGNLERTAPVESSNELGTLAKAFNSMTGQLRELIGSLEQRVQTRTQALEASAEVSRQLSTILDQEALVTAVVEQVQKAFNYYHAHIYLLDETGQKLVMAGGTGEAGQAMLASGHSIAVGQGLVGRAAATQDAVLVPDVSREKGWLPNPLLPDTKAETAVPIAIGDEVLGVLDVQQNSVDSLGQQDVDLLESIAGQVAIALQNARLFIETQRAEAEAVKFKLGIERSDNGIFLTNVAGVIEYVNPAFEELYGYTAAEAIGQTPRILKSGQTPPEQYKAIWQDMLAGRTVSGEIVNKTKDGRLVHINRSNNPIINQDNELIGFLSVNTDISARIQAEETLIRRATELATVAEVGTITATILEPKQLLQQVVDLTKTNFGLYHAHIHLLNENKDTLVLTAGAGKVGQQMVAEGRRIPLVAKNSLVATVARTRQGAIRNYDPPGEGFMPHPLLAETRCEMAVPMALGEDVLGVLDVRSDKLNHFSTTDMQTYSTLAAQVAVALQNARSFASSEQALKEMGELSRRLTREGWKSYMDTAVADLHYAYGTLPDDNKDAAEAENRLSLPLRIQGATIGQLTLTEPQAMTDEAATIVDEVAERLSAHIETLRLATQTEQALAGTEALYRGSDRVVRATTAAGVVQALVESTLLSRFCQTTLFLFNQPWGATPPQTMTVAATLQQGKLLSAGDEVGRQMPLNEFPDAEFLKRDEPFLVADLMHDGRFDEETIALMQHGRPNLRSTVAFPLVAGDDWFGIVTAVHDEPLQIGEEEARRITSLTDQAATVIRNLQLIEQTIGRAQEEQLLREVTARIGQAVDAESILRTAAEEISRALGLEGSVVLGGVGIDHAVKSVNGSRDN